MGRPCFFFLKKNPHPNLTQLLKAKTVPKTYFSLTTVPPPLRAPIMATPTASPYYCLEVEPGEKRRSQLSLRMREQYSFLSLGEGCRYGAVAGGLAWCMEVFSRFSAITA